MNTMMELEDLAFLAQAPDEDPCSWIECTRAALWRAVMAPARPAQDYPGCSCGHPHWVLWCQAHRDYALQMDANPLHVWLCLHCEGTVYLETVYPKGAR